MAEEDETNTTEVVKREALVQLIQLMGMLVGFYLVAKVDSEYEWRLINMRIARFFNRFAKRQARLSARISFWWYDKADKANEFYDKNRYGS